MVTKMKIKKAIDKVPGGMMLIPLFLGAIIHTAVPGASDYFGGFTKGLMTGTVPILAVWFFCMGAMIAVQFMPEGGIQTGFFAGLSVLALISAMDMTNGGLYASIMQQYGTKEESGAFVLMSLESGPLVTMLILGSTGVAVFEPQLFIGAVLPFLVGFILGNLDHDLREYFGKATHTLIPFFGFALGCSIDLGVIADTGLLGILLGLAVIVVTGIPLILADKFIGRGNGTAGLAASSTAGAAVANPMLVANMKPEFLPAAEAATALVAACVIVTAILVPILTAYYSDYMKKKNPPVDLPPVQKAAV